MIACPLCGSARATTFAVQDARSGYDGHVTACLGCGTGRLVPPPTDAQLAAAYAEYPQHTRPATVRSERPLLALNQSLWRGAIPRPLALGILSAVETVTARAIPLKYRIPLMLPRTSRILDVGVATGHYLRLLRSIGFERLAGFDIVENPTVRSTLPHADLRFGPTLDAVGFTPQSFDVVTLVHTLEHVPDPVGVLRVVRALLAPNGRAIIEVPDFGGWVARTSPTTFSHLAVPQHLWHFSARGLAIVCAAAGLTPRRMQHSFSPVVAAESLPDEPRRRRFLLRPFGHFRGMLGSGTELSIECRV